MSNDAQMGLTADEIHSLRDIAEAMIPQSPAERIPGAGDAAILADIAKSLGRDLPLVRDAIAAIHAAASGAFAGMNQDQREKLINDYYARSGTQAVALGRVILAAYYRDDRVLLALGLEARSPFPKGHTVEQGDWSLLDPVRRRAPFWRDDRTSTAKR
jgi:hypothetical protein